MAIKKKTSKIKTPDGSNMDYKVEKLKRKTTEDKIGKELKAKATAKTVAKKISTKKVK
jgi:hypothetical protein